MKRILAGLALAATLGLAACEMPEDMTDTPSATKISKAKDKAKSKSTEPTETPGQENARESAESYLSHQAFSKPGLIDQLKFEGFSTKNATYAVEVVAPNWNKQAVKSAKSYLSHQSFSASGLQDQLEFEGFTPSQAAHGVEVAYR